MSLPVRSCLCRRHSERFGGPFGPRQWLRLLRRSTCSKRGSVRTVFFFFSSIGSFFGGRSLPQSVEFDGEGTRSKETRVKRVLGASRYMYDSEIEFVFIVQFQNFFMRVIHLILRHCYYYYIFLIKHSTREHDESVKLQSQPFVVPINASRVTSEKARGK